MTARSRTQRTPMTRSRSPTEKGAREVSLPYREVKTGKRVFVYQFAKAVLLQAAAFSTPERTKSRISTVTGVFR